MRILFQSKVRNTPYIWERGNQVRILSELVTVFREWTPIAIALPKSARRESER